MIKNEGSLLAQAFYVLKRRLLQLIILCKLFAKEINYYYYLRKTKSRYPCDALKYAGWINRVLDFIIVFEYFVLPFVWF
jgi:hypothetical protein